MLADDAINSSRSLEAQLNLLVQQLGEYNSITNTTGILLDEATEDLDSSENLLDGSEKAIGASRVSLQDLGRRLEGLEALIAENEENLEVARNLTSVAAEVANETELVRID